MPGPAYVIGDTPGQTSGLISGYTNLASNDFWNSVNAARADQAQARSFALQDADAQNRIAQMAWDRYNQANPGPMALANLDFQKQANQRANDTMALDILRTNRALSEPTQQQATREATETAFLWKDALDQANQGVFTNYFDVAKAYPKFSDPEKQALLRQSLQARNQLGQKDTESSSIAGLLNKQLQFKMADQAAVDQAVKTIVANPFQFPTLSMSWLGAGQNNAQKEAAARALFTLPPDNPNYIKTIQKLRELVPELKLDELRQAKALIDTQAVNVQKLKPQAIETLTHFDPNAGGFVPTTTLTPAALGPRTQVMAPSPVSRALATQVPTALAPSGQTVPAASRELVRQYRAAVALRPDLEPQLKRKLDELLSAQ